MITQLLGQLSPIKTALLIGGESMPLQLQQLRARPRILIGTPGRVNDHLGRGSLMLHDAGTLVLDEMDRMLDMGFEDQIMAILRYLPATRQTLLFSATLPPAILKISQKYLKNPARIEVGETNKAVAKIDQQIIQTSDHGKYAALLEQLRKREGTIIIFVRTKQGTEKLATKLRKDGQSADAIHGDLEQYQRERVLQAFRDKQHRILVATDIAARGLDITHIEHVINYDLPMQPEDYIHRIGRTARAGAEGEAVSFITPHDLIKWREIQKLMNPGAEPPALPPSRKAAETANTAAVNAVDAAAAGADVAAAEVNEALTASRRATVAALPRRQAAPPKAVASPNAAVAADAGATAPKAARARLPAKTGIPTATVAAIPTTPPSPSAPSTDAEKHLAGVIKISRICHCHAFPVTRSLYL